MKVRHRMKALGCPVSVHVYNALIATLERANQWDQVRPGSLSFPIPLFCACLIYTIYGAHQEWEQGCVEDVTLRLTAGGENA